LVGTVTMIFIGCKDSRYIHQKAAARTARSGSGSDGHGRRLETFREKQKMRNTL
jgi:hypothetical protein